MCLTTGVSGTQEIHLITDGDYDDMAYANMTKILTTQNSL